jgi:hypothetical protein
MIWLLWQMIANILYQKLKLSMAASEVDIQMLTNME